MRRTAAERAGGVARSSPRQTATPP